MNILFFSLIFCFPLLLTDHLTLAKEHQQLKFKTVCEHSRRILCYRLEYQSLSSQKHEKHNKVVCDINASNKRWSDLHTLNICFEHNLRFKLC